ncbi:alpha/beta hydrolase family protein [Zunongwangia sp. HGR-M22]|uniref:alpha/beta hydrolase family protein n=1 Tax=Zunongwangia sp. HGR-M22 TaxID=3015168 RepID=UPI0022DD5E7D|nr:prolyl oligopeptidase family serine peptidase [Zunongwangia sp. HGR-M22]WBL24657.1 prolyl oligopeptidase family serine peptidase [Zunongwangia sp. HGR-M22]
MDYIKSHILNIYSWKSFILLTVFFSGFYSWSQNSDNNFNKPISKTIEVIEEIYNIKINDDLNLLDNKTLDYADWRIEQNNLEVSLTAILAPFDLMYWKESDSVYSIRKFDYPRRTPDVGKYRLNYLSNLYEDKAEWEERKAGLKSCILDALKLQDAPNIGDPNVILTKKRKYKGYSVENIALEIVPGVYTTGSIYKPTRSGKKSAIILTPNGHFGDGRYRESEQIRCANLAKMGAIVVSYDLFGWGESALQFSSVYHKTSMAQTIQVLNGKKLLDYLLKLPQTDTSRVGITGGSGGGSHTLFLTAIDDRIKVSAPVVMVSSYFSGGCPCESGQPIHLCGNGTNNAEIAAMAAPRPQLIISDGQDWTQNVPELEFPFIKNIYSFYKAEEQVKNVHFPEEGHDYKESKRKAMYQFMAEHLDLDLSKIMKNGKISEEITLETEDQMKAYGLNAENFPKNAISDIEELYALFGQTYEKDTHE